jgi:hypothetical protein
MIKTTPFKLKIGTSNHRRRPLDTGPLLAYNSVIASANKEVIVL